MAHPDPNQRYHDRVAHRYDDIYAKDPYWDYYHDVTWQDLKRSLPRDLGRPVLDAGCGTGLYGLRLMRSGYTVVFSDLSRRMLDVAERKARERFPDREVEAVPADITDLAPFENEQFSLLVAQGDVLSFATDWRKALKNVRRVLAPGGRAVLSVDSRYGGISPFLARQDLDGLVDFLETGDSVWLADRKEERFPLHAFSAAELEKAAPRAGLAVVRVIGKTVFDARGGHPWLEDPARRQTLLQLERRHGESALALGRAHHLQVTLARADDVAGAGDAGSDVAARGRRGRGRGAKKRRKKGAG